MFFKEKVVQLRKEAAMTQEFFAQEVGVSRQAVYKWEKGISYPEAEKLILIAKLFDVSIDSLLEDDFSLFKVRGLKPVAEKVVLVTKAQKKEASKRKKVKDQTATVTDNALHMTEKPEVATTAENHSFEVTNEEEISANKSIEIEKQAEKREPMPLQNKKPVKKQEKKPAGLFDGLKGIFGRRK